jgi:hypothetical protein
MKYLDSSSKWRTYNRYSCTTTSVAVFHLSGRHCLALPFLADMKFTLYMLSICKPQPKMAQYTLTKSFRHLGVLVQVIPPSISQQIHHLHETHASEGCRTIRCTLLRDVPNVCRFANLEQQFQVPVEERWGQEFGWLVLGYDQNVLLNNLFIELQNRLLYCN